MTEHWRELPVHDYYISDLGRIKSCRPINGNGPTLDFEAGRIMKQSSDKDGYKLINIRGLKEARVHRLVMLTFVGEDPDPEKNQVNHINEIKYDNRLENLEWVTAKGNANHGTRNERLVKVLTVHKKKWSPARVQQIANARANITRVKKKAVATKGDQRLEFDSLTDLANHFGVKYIEKKSRNIVISKGKLKGWTITVEDSKP